MILIMFIIVVSVFVVMVSVAKVKRYDVEPEVLKQNQEYLMGGEYNFSKDEAIKIAECFGSYSIERISETDNKAIEQIAVYACSIPGIQTSGSDNGSIKTSSEIQPNLMIPSDVVNKNYDSKIIDKRIAEYERKLLENNAKLTDESVGLIGLFKDKYKHFMTDEDATTDDFYEIAGLQTKIQLNTEKINGKVYVTEGAMSLTEKTEDFNDKLNAFFKEKSGVYLRVKPELIKDEDQNEAIVFSYIGKSNLIDGLHFGNPKGLTVEVDKEDAETYLNQSELLWKDLAKFVKDYWQLQQKK